jgi:ArsR family transcriptional regulator, arsenate/arsenite/antimonite-responsive transcriptional repressor
MKLMPAKPIAIAEKQPGKKPVRLPGARQTAIFKALGDPHRFQLLQRIARAGCPLGCSQALAALPISAATLSHHVKELQSAGLIDVRREGKYGYLTLRPGVLDAVAASLSALESAACPAADSARRSRRRSLAP